MENVGSGSMVVQTSRRQFATTIKPHSTNCSPFTGRPQYPKHVGQKPAITVTVHSTAGESFVHCHRNSVSTLQVIRLGRASKAHHTPISLVAALGRFALIKRFRFLEVPNLAG